VSANASGPHTNTNALARIQLLYRALGGPKSSKQNSRKLVEIMATDTLPATPAAAPNIPVPKITIKELIDALNGDLAREYQAIIAYTVYSSVISGAQWMSIADQLKEHAHEELRHALTIADQIDYLGGMPTVVAKEVKLSDKAEDMLRFDLDNETETIQNYRQRVVQAESLGHYALSEQIRKIIVEEQDHQHDLATALGIDVPKVLEGGA